jgi:hypothetical protein
MIIYVAPDSLAMNVREVGQVHQVFEKERIAGAYVYHTMNGAWSFVVFNGHARNCWNARIVGALGFAHPDPAKTRPLDDRIVPDGCAIGNVILSWNLDANAAPIEDKAMIAADDPRMRDGA